MYGHVCKYFFNCYTWGSNLALYQENSYTQASYPFYAKLPKPEHRLTYIQFWQQFVNFSKKEQLEDIFEEDFLKFLDHLYFKKQHKHLTNYFSKLVLSYKVVHMREFNEDFPNVRKYLAGK